MNRTAGNHGRGFFVRRSGGEVPREGDQRGCLAYAVGLAPLLAVTAVLPFGWVSILIPIGAFLLMSAVNRSFVGLGLSIDHRGITEWHEFGRRRLCTWSEVTRVEADARHLTLHTARRRIRLDAGLCDWRQAAELCQSYLGLAQPEPTPAPRVSERHVADWLGVPPAGTLRLTHRTFFPGWATMVGAGAIALMWLIVCRELPNVTIWWVVPVLWLASVWRPGFRRHWVAEAVVDARRLRFRTLRGWREVGWGDLLALATDGTERIVATRSGEFWLPAGLTDRDRLVEAIAAAICAQNSGQSLPSLADVPDAALSRVTGTPPDAERGLSQQRGGGTP